MRFFADRFWSDGNTWWMKSSFFGWSCISRRLLFFFRHPHAGYYELFSLCSLWFTRLSRLSSMLAKCNAVNWAILIHFSHFFWLLRLANWTKMIYLVSIVWELKRLKWHHTLNLTSGADLVFSVNFSFVGSKFILICKSDPLQLNQKVLWSCNDQIV